MINNLIQFSSLKLDDSQVTGNSLESSNSKVHPIFKKSVDLDNVYSVMNVITISSRGIIF